MSNKQDQLIETLTHSKIYQEYAQAFADATGLPVNLRSVDSWQLPHHQHRNENDFCALMASQSRSCASCLQVQQELAESASQEPRTVACPHGLCDSAVPVRLGEQLIGFLQTGQVFRKPPSPAQFDRSVRLLAGWGLKFERDALKKAYFQTAVLTPKQHDAMIKLLRIFAQHLSMVTNQVVVRHENFEPPVIARARQFIEQHQTEDLSLSQVAKAVNTSTYYFCKMFHKATGIHFTDYLVRIRVEKAKNLLLNPNLRISEIAFEVGFQSLTHFNRVFKRVLGQSPTAYREQLAVA